MRMFGPKGNPRADNLFQVIPLLQDREGICLEVIEWDISSFKLPGAGGSRDTGSPLNQPAGYYVTETITTVLGMIQSERISNNIE